MTRETLEAQLRRLPPEDRAHLARVLLESLDDEPALHAECWRKLSAGRRSWRRGRWKQSPPPRRWPTPAGVSPDDRWFSSPCQDGAY